jgi:peptidoglycan hydrolase-like protein with peptidoglycan-binding domain
MHLVGIVLFALLTGTPAAAQEGIASSPAVTGGKVQLAARKKRRAKPKRHAPAKRDDGLSVAERLVVQYELAWTGDFTGMITGEAGEKTSEAIQSFQQIRGHKATGALTPEERVALAAAAKARQERVGWTIVEDAVTGAQLGIPTKRVPHKSKGESGTRWSSAQGQIQVETFRVREPGTTLDQVYEQQKKEPNRRLSASVLKSDFFMLSGMQRLKFFIVRAAIKDDEVRGMTVLWDQATDPIMGYAAIGMSGAFTPFPTMAVAQPGETPRRKVDYGTGIVVSAAGHVLTDRQLLAGCNVIVVNGNSDAARVAEDATAGLALIRLFGGVDLKPAALLHDGAKGPDLTLVGVADPQSQDGGSAVSTVAAKINADVVVPAPPPGFSGAAALDSQGSIYGMVKLKAPAEAAVGAAAVPAQATIVPVAAARAFLAAQKLVPVRGPAGIDAAKAAVVRVICVRK